MFLCTVWEDRFSIKVENNFRVIVIKNPRNYGHMVDGIDSPVNWFQKKAVEVVLYFVSFKDKRTRSFGFRFQLLELRLSDSFFLV